ncbi:tachykinin-like peptides receptor 86C [Pollicipes pollicipes]|uniref:tachykinin-like peptides receptor 86C n=1 Tax=Pollicipes pollicipes TaxID=41117 RepID=UPI0018859279|nr:tachykinin-like peptides receptor 86C [Pollicipes pollicipes]
MAWLPWAVWMTAFVLMLLVAIGGNIIVCWIILAHRQMRTVANYFLVNLSVANLLMSCLNCSFNFVYMLNANWPFGASYCVLNNFMANLTVAASVLTLMAIALERYLVILHPLRRRLSKRGAIVGIVGIWTGSTLLSLPCILYSQVISHTYSGGNVRHGCVLVWDDGPPMISFTDYVYNMVFLTTTYVFPMLAMAVSYCIIGRELWGSRSIGIQTDRQLASVRSKRKIVRMFIIVVTTFAVCWLPYQAYFVYVYHDSSLARADFVQHLFLAFYWLAMSYAMVNPLIYFWMNKRFRAYLRQLFRCCASKRSLECFVTEPRQYMTNGFRSRQSRRSHVASERTRLERTSSTMIGSAASPILQQPPPELRAVAGRRESDVSGSYATPESSPDPCRPAAQVRLLLRPPPPAAAAVGGGEGARGGHGGGGDVGRDELSKAGNVSGEEEPMVPAEAKELDDTSADSHSSWAESTAEVATNGLAHCASDSFSNLSEAFFDARP